jgi:hypothetical protein
MVPAAWVRGYPGILADDSDTEDSDADDSDMLGVGASRSFLTLRPAVGMKCA